MERKYTESELRQRLTDKVDQFIIDLIGRLRDDNVFKLHSLDISGTLFLDGELVSDWTPFQHLFSEAIGKFVPEFISELFVTLFEDDNNA